MSDQPVVQERIATLGARIAVARARLAARQGMDEDGIGSVIAELNDDLDTIVHEDRDEAARRLDKIEARLVAEEIRIEEDREDAKGD